MNVVVLPSSRTRTASHNLKNLVAKARESSAFGPIDFDDAVWEVLLVKTKRASSGRVGINRLYFTESKVGARTMVGRTPLRQPFADFLKAVVRLREDDAARDIEIHAGLIGAGRFLHATMEAIAFDPCCLTQDHFLEAAAASRKVDKGSTAYGMGKKLVEIADWINRFNVARTRIDFRNPNPRVDDSNVRFGAEAEARRESKLPSEAELDALARLANLVTEDVDVLRMRTIELLVCGGWRINELLSIPADCEVEETAYENGQPVLDDAGSPVVRYGIRYYGEKGASPLPKWIPSALVSVAKRAVADIRRITQPTRDAAAWMADHPGRVMLPGFMTEDLDELISLPELGRVLGFVASPWCRGNHVPVSKGSYRTFARKRDVAEALIAGLPVVSSETPLKLCEHLFLIPVNFTHADRATVPGTVRFLTDGMIASFIGGHGPTRSVFDRFDIRDDQGERIRMNTHQFRHWLNTLAQQGGMGQMEIARWSGRKDVKQNAAYDHVSGIELGKRLRSLVEAGSMRGPLATVHERLPPKDRETFRETHMATGHVTDIGVCIHDWSLVPCSNHGACAGCDEHVVVKGDPGKRDEAGRLLEETRFLLSKAEEEIADETYGADRWVETHRRMVTSLEAIMAVHADETIVDGTLVQIGQAN